MAVPKGKVSKSRRDKRRANWKATAPTLVECPHCHEKKVAHKVCKNCGEKVRSGKISKDESF